MVRRAHRGTRAPVTHTRRPRVSRRSSAALRAFHGPALYHITGSDNLDGIKKRGLVPHGPSFGTDQSAWPDGGREKRTYFNRKRSSVEAFASSDNGKPVILRTRARGIRHERGTGDSYARTRIHQRRIEVERNGKFVPLRRVSAKAAAGVTGKRLRRRLRRRLAPTTHTKPASKRAAAKFQGRKTRDNHAIALKAARTRKLRGTTKKGAKRRR